MTRTVVFSDHTLGMGGGERYLLALLDGLLARGPVELLVGSDGLRPNPARFRSAFGWELERPDLSVGVLDDPESLRGADLFVNLSHFRVLPPLARRNLVAVFFPQLLSEWIGRYDAVVTISEFSAEWIRRYWNVDHIVVLPPAVAPVARGEKTPTILSVGRFFHVRDGNVKQHRLLVDAFRALRERGHAGWRLVLAGMAAPEHGDYVDELRRACADLPVDIVVNATVDALAALYGQATLYWHAAGMTPDGLTGVPSAAEHFGIALVEAMSAGAVPIAPAIGGPTEIITSERSGMLCHQPEELVVATDALIRDPRRLGTLAAGAVARATEFSPVRFLVRLHECLDALGGDAVRAARFFLQGGASRHAMALLADAVDAPGASSESWAVFADAAYRSGHREVMRLALERRCAIDPVAREARTLLARSAPPECTAFDAIYFEQGAAHGVSGYTAFDGTAAARNHADMIVAGFRPTSCLDVGCARGDLVAALAQRGVPSIGVDVSTWALGRAPAGIRGTALAAGRIDRLPFADDTFDIVVAIELLEHVPEPQVDAALAELARVSRRLVWITVQNTTAAAPAHFFADRTHVTMKPLVWWVERCRRAGLAALPMELPLGEFRGHQIVGRPARLPASDPAAAFDAAERRAQQLLAQAAAGEALAVLEHAAPLAERLNDSRRTQRLLVLLARAHLGLGRTADAEACLDLARAMHAP